MAAGMRRPSVSVVMAVRNGERHVAAAIASVRAQTHAPDEILVVDGGSSDRTAEIARSFAGVRCVAQTDRGVANAYNLGIATTTGDFVAFLSHDDLWTPDKLAVQVAHMERHPELQYTTARVRFFLEPGCAIPSGFRPELLDGDHVGTIMETLVARRSVFGVVGPFDPALATAEDVDWFARARDLGVAAAVVPQVLLRKRVHDTNLSITTTTNDRDILAALQRSIARKRERG
jgi:glycosyltransferase involved in cell wall biosynthesis